ncbi:hypothetical protein LXA43DRAFT_885334 [Ganoderma leucocontextum]|nr:hypothetical protein LXA43DRAFT_885334 [Ganoderma leucocontextum]
MRVHPISSAGRPPEVSGPNVVIFSGPAALLLEHVQNLEREPVDPNLYDACAALSDVCARFYSTEAERRRAAQPILDRLFGVTTSERGNPMPTKGTPVAFDLVEVVRTGDGKTDAFILCVEVKNELGKAGPGHLQIEFTFQNLVVRRRYYRPIRDNSLCPTILVNISDGYIRIAYAIFTDTVVVKPILDWHPLTAGDNDQRCKDIEKLARTVQAVRTAIEDLRRRYQGLSPATGEQPPPYLPNPMPTPSTTFPPNITFIDRLSSDLSQSLFRAKLDDDHLVAVEFCTSWDADAHDVLARNHLAPLRRWSGPITGGLTMVVMSLEPDTVCLADKYPYAGRSLPEEVRGEVRRAVNLLHQGDPPLVHGDIRRHKILLLADGSIRLVGFLSSGKVGQARYPPTLSLDRIRSVVDGARAGGPILISHDLQMCDQL